jgi:hypothetical protein
VLITCTAERVHVHRLTYTEDVIFMLRRNLREIMLQKFTERLTIIIIIIIIITSQIFYKYFMYVPYVIPIFQINEAYTFPARNFRAFNFNYKTKICSGAD